ncbi:Porin (modular protein) [Vibrio chagasii]|nr:Porin (modular protein) [Vibrio chagasii]
MFGTGYSGVGPGMLGIALGWAKPNAELDDSYNSEIYYRMNWGALSLTPNVQYLHTLPFNSKADDSWIIGLRGNLHFGFSCKRIGSYLNDTGRAGLYDEASNLYLEIKLITNN